MGVAPSTLQKLVALARETSAEQRRALLHEVTDLFFDTPPGQRSAVEAEHFDVILASVAEEMTDEVRAELARRFADAPDAPRRLLRQLAEDDISIAGRILRRSLALDDDELISIARSEGQDHLRAIAGRDTVSERVSDVIGDRADPATMAALVANPGAALSRRTLERAVDQAPQCPDLHAPLVNRADMPDEFLTEMYLFVEKRLKEKIEARQIDVSDDALRRALDNARRKAPAQPEDYGEAIAFITKCKLRRELEPTLLARLLRDGERTRFLVALAELTDIDFEASRRAYEDTSGATMALVCKAAGLDRSLFVTLAVLRAGAGGRPVETAREFARMYDEVPPATAERVMRFWRLRKAAAERDSFQAA